MDTTFTNISIIEIDDNIQDSNGLYSPWDDFCQPFNNIIPFKAPE